MDLSVDVGNSFVVNAPDFDGSAIPSSGRLESYNPAKKFVGISSTDLQKQSDQSNKRIKALICYICQKEYNIKKIEAHLKHCKNKWELT